jgi:hypothetical protein
MLESKGGSEVLKETKELMAILSNQKGSVIPQWLVKGAAAQLDSSQPNTSKAESIITQLKKGEMHPAMGDKIRKAEKEISEHKTLSQNNKRSLSW